MITVVKCFSVYKIPITLIYGTRKECNRWLKKHDLDPMHDTAAANYRIYPDKDEGGGQTGLISLIQKSSPVDEICALLHEVIHCAVYTFEKVDIPITDLHEEPFCYFVESIMHQALTGIAEWRSRRS